MEISQELDKKDHKWLAFQLECRECLSLEAFQE